MIIFELKLEDTFTRCEKYPSELDISHSFIRIFTMFVKILSLSLKNIEASFIFLTRLFVSLQS